MILHLSGFSCEGDDSDFGGWFGKGDRSPYKRVGRHKLMSTSLGNAGREGESKGMGTGDFRSMNDASVKPTRREL